MKTFEQLRADLVTSLADFKTFGTGHTKTAFVNLMDALLESYQQDLVTLPVDRIPATQGAAQQIRALREAFVSEGTHLSPKI